jgi:hypothetical protein
MIAVRTGWEMYSSEGDERVTDQVQTLIDDIDHDRIFRYQLEGRVHAIFRRVELSGHSEVYDTEPRRHIYAAIDAACASHGWKGIDEF